MPREQQLAAALWAIDPLYRLAHGRHPVQKTAACALVPHLSGAFWRRFHVRAWPRSRRSGGGGRSGDVQGDVLGDVQHASVTRFISEPFSVMYG